MKGPIVLVGSDTFLGRELRERWDEAGRSRERLRLVEPGGEEAVLSAVGGELDVSTPRLEEALSDASVVVLAAPVDDVVRKRLIEAAGRIAVLDLTGQLEAEPLDARGPEGQDTLRPGAWVSPTAAALVVGALVRAAVAAGASGPVTGVVVEPASEIGREALDELHAQAVAMLTFQTPPMEILGTRVVHDIASPGAPGGAREARVRAEAGALARRAGAPVPLLLRALGGVFHGVAVAARCDVAVDAWRAALREETRVALGADPALATPAGAVQAEAALVGRLESDGADGAWAWVAADTLRHGSVGNALELLLDADEETS